MARKHHSVNEIVVKHRANHGGRPHESAKGTGNLPSLSRPMTCPHGVVRVECWFMVGLDLPPDMVRMLCNSSGLVESVQQTPSGSSSAMIRAGVPRCSAGALELC